MENKVEEESKKKLSVALMGNTNAKGKPKPPGFGEKISKVLKGKKRTKEQRENISKGKLGHEVTDETREKISRANRGRKRTAEQRARMAEAQQARYAKEKEGKENESQDGL